MLLQLEVFCEELRDVGAFFTPQRLALERSRHVRDAQGRASEEEQRGCPRRLGPLGQARVQRGYRCASEKGKRARQNVKREMYTDTGTARERVPCAETGGGSERVTGTRAHLGL